MSGGARYLLRRLAFYVLAALFAITINFLVVRLMPGDPATALLGRLKGELDPESIAALRQAFGLTDGTVFSQYIDYLSSTLRGDLGISIAYFPQPVSEVMATGLMWTAFLNSTEGANIGNALLFLIDLYNLSRCPSGSIIFLHRAT